MSEQKSVNVTEDACEPSEGFTIDAAFRGKKFALIVLEFWATQEVQQTPIYHNRDAQRLIQEIVGSSGEKATLDLAMLFEHVTVSLAGNSEENTPYHVLTRTFQIYIEIERRLERWKASPLWSAFSGALLRLEDGVYLPGTAEPWIDSGLFMIDFVPSQEVDCSDEKAIQAAPAHLAVKLKGWNSHPWIISSIGLLDKAEEQRRLFEELNIDVHVDEIVSSGGNFKCLSEGFIGLHAPGLTRTPSGCSSFNPFRSDAFLSFCLTQVVEQYYGARESGDTPLADPVLETMFPNHPREKTCLDTIQALFEDLRKESRDFEGTVVPFVGHPILLWGKDAESVPYPLEKWVESRVKMYGGVMPSSEELESILMSLWGCVCAVLSGPFNRVPKIIQSEEIDTFDPLVQGLLNKLPPGVEPRNLLSRGSVQIVTCVEIHGGTKPKHETPRQVTVRRIYERHILASMRMWVRQLGCPEPLKPCISLCYHEDESASTVGCPSWIEEQLRDPDYGTRHLCNFFLRADDTPQSQMRLLRKALKVIISASSQEEFTQTAQDFRTLSELPLRKKPAQA